MSLAGRAGLSAMTIASPPMDPATRDALLRWLGLDRAPATDLAGLQALHRAYATRVPFEALEAQLGTWGPLDPPALARRLLGGRGGYCFEVNTVLHDLLAAVGFAVVRHEALVGPRERHGWGDPPDHLTLVVQLPDDGPFIADAGLGAGLIEPIPLREGHFQAGPFHADLARDGDGWWVGLHELAGMPGFRFSDAPATLDAFQPHHARMSGAEDSQFVRTLVVQRPAADHITTLRARTFSIVGPDRREQRVVDGPEDFAAALARLGVDPEALGPERLARLWARACAQHEAFVREQ